MVELINELMESLTDELRQILPPNYEAVHTTTAPIAGLRAESANIHSIHIYHTVMSRQLRIDVIQDEDQLASAIYGLNRSTPGRASEEPLRAWDLRQPESVDKLIEYIRQELPHDVRVDNPSPELIIMCLANVDLNDPKLSPMERQAIKDALRQYGPQVQAYKEQQFQQGNGLMQSVK